MNRYSLSHVPDRSLVTRFTSLLADERAHSAVVLAHLAEIDARKLYCAEGYPSMYRYCVGAHHFSEEAAFKRIHAARAARRFPAIFEALADGRLHLSAVVLLAPRLTPANAGPLLAAAEHRTKAEIEGILAEWFPRLDVPPHVQPLMATEDQHAPGRVEASGGSMEEHRDAVGSPVAYAQQHAPGRVGSPVAHTQQHAPGRVGPPVAHAEPRPRVEPLAPSRFAIQFTVGNDTRERLRYAQDLLGHQIPSGDLAEVFAFALEAAIEKLEKRKFAATTRPRGAWRGNRVVETVASRLGSGGGADVSRGTVVQPGVVHDAPARTG